MVSSHRLSTALQQAYRVKIREFREKAIKASKRTVTSDNVGTRVMKIRAERFSMAARLDPPLSAPFKQDPRRKVAVKFALGQTGPM